jgi:hypothetical protein
MLSGSIALWPGGEEQEEEGAEEQEEEGAEEAAAE